MQINYYGDRLGCGCRGSCTCYLPSIPRPKKTAPKPRIDSDVLVNMLIATVGCGNSSLNEYLKKYAPLIIKRNGYCQDELMFIGAQVDLIDLSLQFVASMVDYSDSRSHSRSTQMARSRSTTEAKAQATSYANSCGYSDATSFNQFIRDSYDRARSQSNTDSESSGRSDSHTWDRSQQEAQELSQVWDTSRSESDGEGRGDHFETSDSSGASYSRTAPTPSILYNDLNAGNAALRNISNFFTEIWKGLTDPTVGGRYAWNPLGSNSFEFNYDEFGKPVLPAFTILDNIFGDTIDNTYSDPGGQVPVTGISTPDQYCCCEGLLIGPVDSDCSLIPGGRNCHWQNEVILPTEGEMYSVNWKLSVGFTYLKKTIKFDLSWGRSGNWNRSHVITKACTKSTGQSQTTNFYDQTDWSRAHGETLTEQHSYTQRDYHVRADSERDAHSRTDAGSANTGDAQGKSESGAERASHSEGRGAGQGSNVSKTRSRANSLTVSDSESKSIAENLSDIFEALSRMRDILWDQKQQYRARFRAMQGAAIGKIPDCCYSIPADPVTQAKLRSLHTKWHEYVKPPTYRQPKPVSQAGITCIGA